jgi:hypothetical protein
MSRKTKQLFGDQLLYALKYELFKFCSNKIPDDVQLSVETTFWLNA